MKQPTPPPPPKNHKHVPAGSTVAACSISHILTCRMGPYLPKMSVCQACGTGRVSIHGERAACRADGHHACTTSRDHSPYISSDVMLKGRFLTNNILHACQQTTHSCVLALWCMLALQHDGNQTAPHRWTSAASEHNRAGASALAANSAMHACTLTGHSPGGNRWLRALAAAAAMMKALPDQACAGSTR